MQPIKLLFAALIVTIPLLGCGGATNSTAAGAGAELTPDQIAEQDAVLNAAEAEERALKKGR